jgi:hypothetical protein
MFLPSSLCYHALIGVTLSILAQQGSQHILKTAKLDEFAATELNPETLATELPETGDDRETPRQNFNALGDSTDSPSLKPRVKSKPLKEERRNNQAAHGREKSENEPSDQRCSENPSFHKLRKIWHPTISLRRVVSGEKEYSEKRCGTLLEDGLMATDTAFSAKNGKNPRF